MQVMAGATHGGAEAFFERLVPALARSGVEQHVVIRENANRAAALRRCGIVPTELPFGGLFDFITRRALRGAVEAFNPDVALAWMSRAAKYCQSGSHILAGRLGGYYDLKHYRNCAHLIGNTRDIRDYLIRSGWPPDRAWYLPNFVEAAEDPPVDRRALETPDDAPVILAMGRLHPNKAFDVLLAAMPDVPTATLWLAGDGPLASKLRKSAHSLGIEDRVRFLGWRDDVAALMRAADIFVCPSRHEPLGNVILEAWAYEKPTIAAASKGPSDLIHHNETGLIVPVEDANALATAIGRLLNDPALAKAIAAAGRYAFLAEYTEKAVVAQYLEFFKRVTH